MNRLLVSAAHKSSGKTTVTLGLCAALRRRGQVVQPFKKGPDYIDPMWLAAASGRDCHNLDFYLMTDREILATVGRRAAGSDLSLIEGNKGLYDGLDLEGSNSNAALARLLDAPVVLVIDARGMTRGIAPLILGYQAFDRAVRIAGVILNQLGGSRHEAKLRAVIEHYTDVPVLGAVHHDDRLTIVERHLGLVPSNEAREPRERIESIAKVIADSVDLDRVIDVARAAPPLPRASSRDDETDSLQGTREGPPASGGPHPSREREHPPVRLGVARDAAFAFYYPGDLEALRGAGAELVRIDTLRDAHLPDVDGLFIGGGFPEVQMEALEDNVSLRREIRDAIEHGLPVYAECGGLMYLSRSIAWKGRRCEMVGAIPADTVMHDRPQGRGYVLLRDTGENPWVGSIGEVRAHEFHYSGLENVDPGLTYAYEVLRGSGVDGKRDGIVYRNVLACYAHMRHLESNPWATRFVDFIRAKRKDRATRLAAP
ncbi:hydrogenase expression protein HypE [Sulfurifustis variabilis]|uniref:Cobyrinate a,c-diamide synthase n=1 Tax=Sulfurifustis variabilis TaxID=1675686 RepID=A0A1B4V4R7_9GAMM|nr:cobyrinate a,c-diamide synthase [Sulfurifustis variabilis]BAU48519.1 hydrogenase expression protein HypE [Sulfurifustis variabilis]